MTHLSSTSVAQIVVFVITSTEQGTIRESTVR